MTTDSEHPGSGEPARRADNDVQGELRYRVLSVRAIVAWAVLMVLVGVGMAVWLLLAYAGGDTDANRVHLDAIRTAGTIVVGAGGAAALLLAARRQRTAEIALKQKDRDQADVARAYALQERVAAATEADAEARRITDLYTKAVDQLGSEKAPVRLGGLYALERLAQDNPSQRQTIVNVLCAYLRMPGALAGVLPDDTVVKADLSVCNTVTPEALAAAVGDNVPDPDSIEYREWVQEREVRLTIQRLLADHLRPGPDARHPVATFWADIDLDLSGAHLIRFNLSDCTVRTVTFSKATFTAGVDFQSTTFTGDALFGITSFGHYTHFQKATFTGRAWFASATFTGQATFSEATFAHAPYFDNATFTAGANFYRAAFNSGVSFRGVNFAWGPPPEIQRFWSPRPKTRTATDAEDAEGRRHPPE